VVDDSGQRFVGHDAIRRWSDAEFIGAKGHMIVTSVEQKENVVNVTADWEVTISVVPAALFSSSRIRKSRRCASRAHKLW
jgi:hypothetical protein